MSMRIGLVGLGRMGLPICGNLARAGHDVVATDQRTELEPEAVAVGAGWAESPRGVAEGANALITVLPAGEDVREALIGSGGALKGMQPGAVWIDMSSCTPAIGHQLREQAVAHGVRCLDAPIGGDPAAALEGTLQVFVGGEADVLEDCRELLEAVADRGRISHVGPNGAGYLTKLLVNLLWFGQALATAEALLLARRAGLDLGVVRDTIASSSASSHFVRTDLDALLEGDYLTSFPLAGCCEELQAVTAMARENGTPHELASVVESIYNRALDRYGPVDGELMGVALLEEAAGLQLRHPS